ncbi:helix-turn-helix domain-containing protein [Nocardioides sp. YR527]|uniref:helix-turn-helix domain-containing protein n=1 Tax=Nocardioides sp. YR527 TaxID=1881028 RepID=UPI00115FF39F|nr:helix-turn-helix domain-containing protein [Nocardioides sp. YR527]
MTRNPRQSLDRSVLRLGTRVRELRKAHGMTLVQLAEATDLSHPFLSQIERGMARPSMSSLFRIAETLGTTQQALLADSVETASAGPAAVVRRSDPGTAEASNGAVQALVAGADHAFIPMEFTGDETTWDRYWQHEEDEFVYVVGGTLRIDLDGEEQTMETADSVYIPGGVRHRWASADGELFGLLVVKEQRGR